MLLAAALAIGLAASGQQQQPIDCGETWWSGQQPTREEAAIMRAAALARRALTPVEEDRLDAIRLRKRILLLCGRS